MDWIDKLRDGKDPEQVFKDELIAAGMSEDEAKKFIIKAKEQLDEYIDYKIKGETGGRKPIGFLNANA